MGGCPTPLVTSTDQISIVFVSEMRAMWHIRVSFRLHRRLQRPPLAIPPISWQISPELKV